MRWLLAVLVVIVAVAEILWLTVAGLFMASRIPLALLVLNLCCFALIASVVSLLTHQRKLGLALAYSSTLIWVAAFAWGGALPVGFMGSLAKTMPNLLAFGAITLMYRLDKQRADRAR